jgi:hypothetical protein
MDFTFHSTYPRGVLPIAATLILFNFYYLALSLSGLFPALDGDIEGSETLSPLTLRQITLTDRLPLTILDAVQLDVLMYALAGLSAALVLAATSSIHNCRALFPLALLAVAASLCLDALFVLPSIHALRGLLRLSSSLAPEITVLTVRTVARTLIFFVLKACMLGLLLCARAPAQPQSARALLWAAAAEALAGPEPALWTLPWATNPGASLKVLRRGGLAGLARSASSLLACTPPKHALASLLSLLLLVLFISTFATQLTYYETVARSFLAGVRVQLPILTSLATSPIFSGGFDSAAVGGYLSFLSEVLDVLVSILDSSGDAIWIVFAICLASIGSSMVSTAQDHLSIMATFPAPQGCPELPLPAFLLEDNNPPGHGMRLHVKGEAAPHWESRIPFYMGPWYTATKRCGLGGQPEGPRDSSGIAPPGADAGAGAGAGGEGPGAGAPRQRATVWLTPNVSPGVDKQLVPGFSYIFFFVITQITFGFYVTVVVALGILGLRFLVNHPEILLPPLLTALGKKVGDTVLHYCLTVDGIIQRPRCWLLLDPSWGLLSILGSTPSALVRFAIAIVEGVLRSTQMHRPSASGLLASLDPGFGAYMCVPPLLKAARRLPFFPPSLP